jgi:hypothetical protein
MQLVLAISLVALLSATPAPAAELPSRKPGLWQVKTSIENSNAPVKVIQQCIDATTDQMLQSSAGPLSAAACPERDVKRSDASMTIDSACTLDGKGATAHADVSGSFDSAYTMTVTALSEAMPGGKMIMTMEGKWLGPCAADQKPGDIILSNGTKINVPELQKRSPLPENSPPPR